jgi:hypothetical protein
MSEQAELLLNRNTPYPTLCCIMYITFIVLNV